MRPRAHLRHLVLLAMSFFGAALFAADVVTTFCGNGTASDTGDGGQASAATVNDPVALVRDSSGNLYFTEASGHRVRKIDTTGVITTIAGTGVAGYSGDGGPATAAQLHTPVGLLVDGSGNIIFSEQQNHIIRKVDAAGIISTIAGTGVSGYSGDTGAATAALLTSPASMTFDLSGNIIFGDINNHTIRIITISDGKINTIVGNGSAGFVDNVAGTSAQIDAPGGMFVNAAGDLIFVDCNNNRVRKLSAGTVTTIAGNGTAGFGGDGGPALSAQFKFNNGGGGVNGAVIPDGQNGLIITDTYNSRIRKISGGNVDTIAGNGSATFNGDGLTPLATALTPNGTLLNSDGGLTFIDGQRIRTIMINPPAPTSASISAVFTSGGVDFETRSVKSGTTVKWTGAGVDPSNINLQFTWDFGDGSAAVTGKSVSHLMSVATGESSYTVTLTAGHANGSVTTTTTISVAAPASGGTTNIAQGDSAIVNPLLDIKTKLFDSDGGVFQFDVSGTAIGRAPFDLNTDFDGLKGRIATRPGFRPLQRLGEPGMIVATHKATDTGTGLDAGKARHMLAVSDRELGLTPSTLIPPASHKVKLKSLTGKFLFGRSGAATVAKPDAVTYSGTIELPAGLDLTQNQTVSIGIGNIIDSAVVSPKGKVTLPSTLKNIKKLQVKFPKLAKGTTTTTAGQLASVTIGLSALNMSANGFDTEGVTSKIRSDEAGAKSVTRNIQVALVIGGVAYDSLDEVQFKLSKKQDAGAISGRGAR